MYTITCLFVDNAVDWLSGHMKARYCSMRLKKYEEEKDPWPPFQTKSYITLALVHQKESQTRQETTATICLRTIGDIHKILKTFESKKLTDITQIFDPVSGRVAISILIEGHAGIGKTTFVKEICIEWAEGKLLTSEKLVLLLLLRDSNVQEITDEQKLIEHFTNHSTTELHKHLVKSHGAGVTLIIDGFDELSTELRRQSFFRKLIEKKVLPEARIVVTSRPSASACLKGVVDKRIEILGFEQSSKNLCVTEALQDYPSKLEKLQRHFQQYPNIDAICYIPLIMSIIIYLCKVVTDELPPTATKMFESFILHTICHYLKRKEMIPEDKIIKKLEQLSPEVCKALQELEKTAFDGLVKDDNKIVFTVEELPVLCKHDPTCYGLLQSTECYNAEGIGPPLQSFNFLHLGIQEYFAAKYINNTLSKDEVYKLLKESFIVTQEKGHKLDPDSKSVHLSNMWIMYCGITSGQCKALRHYLTAYGKPDPPIDNEILTLICSSTPSVISQSSHDQMIAPTAAVNSHVFLSDHTTNEWSSDQRISNTGNISQDILNDTLKVLYLFQCFQEAGDNVLCEVLLKSFDSDEIDISGHILLPHQVESLGFFLSRSHKKYSKLNLQRCHIGDRSMVILHQYLCGDKANKQEITEIKLITNDLTEKSSHLIGGIINHLESHTLDLDNNNITNVKDISTAVINTSTVKVLNMEYNGITAQEAGAISDMLTCLEELDIRDNKLDNHGAELLSEGITNTKTLRVLNISENNIGPSGITAIAHALTNNTSLEELSMGNNSAEQDGTIAIGKVITKNKKLRKLLLHDDHYSKYDLINVESALIIIRSLDNNNTITKLDLPIRLCESDINFVTGKAEMVNSKRKSHNEHIIDFP